MSFFKRRFLFYVLTYFVIAGLAALGLIYNIKTVYLNEMNQTLNRQIAGLETENTTLELKILEASRLDSLEKFATEKMNLVPPDEIVYFSLNSSANVQAQGAK